MAEHRLINVGEISGVFGVKGWVKVFSYTQPRENILTYSPWQLRKGEQHRTLEVIDGQRQGKNVVAQLEGIDNRDAAASLTGWEIFIDRSQLPEAYKDEYYWADLCGLKVVTQDNIELGVVDHLLETGANDVLVVMGERERLIPFILEQTIIKVDLDGGYLIVDWDPDF